MTIFDDKDNVGLKITRIRISYLIKVFANKKNLAPSSILP